MRKRKTAVVCGIVLLTGSLTGCGWDKYNEPYRDAPRGATNDKPADVLTMPDGFSNIATKCDGSNRVYVIYKGDERYGSISVVPNDPRCK